MRDLKGQRFGRWLVLGSDPLKKQYWLCRCDCGAERSIFTSSLLYNKTRSRSCGCLARELSSQRVKTHPPRLEHGDTKNNRIAPEHSVWTGMNTRCYKPTHPKFRLWGGRGITVCAEWRDSYAAFLAHVGRRPSPKHSIDRIDNNGNYEPGNVRWTTNTEQARNRRTVTYVLLHGERMTLPAACEAVGLPHRIVYQRITRDGWSTERALSEPIHPAATFHRT